MEREDIGARPSSGRVFLKHLSSGLPNREAHFIFWLLAAAGTAFDLWSKWAVFSWLEHHDRSHITLIDGLLRFVMALNNGAAFNIAAGRSTLLIVVSVIAIVVVIGLFFFGGSRHKLVHIAFGLFMAGICGNLYDRIFNDGLVRDFIDVYWRSHHWPSFNIADSMLCIGVGLLLISSFVHAGKDD